MQPFDHQRPTEEAVNLLRAIKGLKKLELLARIAMDFDLTKISNFLLVRDFQMRYFASL